MKQAIYLLLLFVSITLFSCDKEDAYGKICASVSGNELKISNHMPVPVYYLILDRDFATVANWAKTCNVQNRIDASGSLEIDLADIPEYKNNNEVVIYWWTDCSTVDNVQSLVISTQGYNSVCSR